KGLDAGETHQPDSQWRTEDAALPRLRHGRRSYTADRLPARKEQAGTAPSNFAGLSTGFTASIDSSAFAAMPPATRRASTLWPHPKAFAPSRDRAPPYRA